MSFWKKLFGGGRQKTPPRPVRPRTKADEFNDAALIARAEGKDQTVERILVRKALNEFLEKISWDMLQKVIYEQTEGFYERDTFSLDVEISGFEKREEQHGRIKTHDSSKYENSTTLSEKTRLKDKITKHIVFVSKPDLIPKYEEAEKIISLAEEHKIAVTFSVSQTPLLTKGNQILIENQLSDEDYDSWYRCHVVWHFLGETWHKYPGYSADDDIESSQLHINFSRLEI